MKTMKKFAAFLSALVLVLSLAACGGGSAKEVDPKALADDMLAALKSQGETMEVTGDVAANYYEMGEAVKEYRVYVSTMYIGEEVAVFQLKDTKDADTVKKMCEARIQSLLDSFDGYLPEEYDTVKENAVVLSEGDIVAMVGWTPPRRCSRRPLRSGFARKGDAVC